MAAGALTGALVGTALAPGVGTAIGAAGGALIENMPKLLGNEQSRYVRKRLDELQRMQEMGTLGLSEEEKKAIFGNQVAQIQGQLDAAQAQLRAAGAAGMQGAGAAQLQAAKAAETQAGLTAVAQRGLEAADIERKRQQEQEIEKLISMKAQKQKERQEAIAEIGSAAFTGATEAGFSEFITGASPQQPAGLSNRELQIQVDTMNQNLPMDRQTSVEELRELLEMGADPGFFKRLMGSY